jgi:ribonuclease HI
VRTLSTDPDLLIVSCDGAARGNPGPAGIGVQITDADGAVVDEIAEGLGETTNNVAEYTAALRGLGRAAELGASRVILRSDSKLLIEQLAGRYRVRAAHLQDLHRAVMGQVVTFREVRFEHVRRERNQEADRLANAGVDAWLLGRD